MLVVIADAWPPLIVVVLPARAVVPVEPNCKVVTEPPNAIAEPSIVILEFVSLEFAIEPANWVLVTPLICDEPLTVPVGKWSITCWEPETVPAGAPAAETPPKKWAEPVSILIETSPANPPPAKPPPGVGIAAVISPADASIILPST